MNILETLKLARQALEQTATDLHHDNFETEEAALVAIDFAIEELEKQEQGEPDWKALVLNHNAECESRCNMDSCGYKPYFEYSKRRCPNCPVHEMIDVEHTKPQPAQKPLTRDDLWKLWCNAKAESEYLFWWEFARAIEAAHGIWPENSDCHGPDWTDRDGEYLK